MVEKTQGIVLKTLPYSDTSLIAKIFTKEFGLLSFLIQGVRKNNNKGKGNLLQPLHILNLDIYYREHKNLLRIKDFNIDFIYSEIVSDFYKKSVAIFFIELTHKCIKENEINIPLYNLLYEALIDLETTENIQQKAIFFQLNVASVLGFEPLINDDETYKYFDLENGVFTQYPNLQHNTLDIEDAIIFKKIIAIHQNNLEVNFSIFSLEKRRKILEILNTYFQFHIPNFVHLQSTAILQQILNA